MAKIGIIGAMELEVDALKAAMEVKNTVTRAGMEFKEGTLNGADVVVVRSGIGKVNAALCVQILVDLFQITHVINTGVAGSLNADLDIGDILIPKMRFIMMWMLPYSGILWESFHRWESGNLSQMKSW